MVERSNRPGREYETNRLASSLAATWRTRLSTEEIATVSELVAAYPLPAFP